MDQADATLGEVWDIVRDSLQESDRSAIDETKGGDSQGRTPVK